MAAKTIWIMEDEEEALDLLELYQEARAHVDSKHPRNRVQLSWLWSHGNEWLNNVWFASHNTMFALERELDDER